MKKLTLLIPLILSFFVGLSQQRVQRSSVNNTVDDPHLFTTLSFRTPVFADTTAANAITSLDSCGKMIFTYDVNAHWTRACNPKRWVRVGGAVIINSSTSILVNGDGVDTAYLPTLIVSPDNNNVVQIRPNGVFVPSQVQNGLIEGGRVIHRTGLTYTVQAARYAINGVVYTSPEVDITLDNADLNDPRFDAFVVTTSSTADNITGTPSSDPQNPSYDPLTQLPLTFVQVLANAIEPVICRDSIYYPNNGNTYTAFSSNPTRINVTSTTDPYSITQAIAFTAAQNNDQLRMEKGSTISVSTYAVMVLRMKSGGVWASTSRIEVQFYSNLTPLGVPVIIGDATPYGFNSSNAAQFQTPIIPLDNFGSGLATANAIVITVKNTGANTITFRLDDWELLGCEGAPVPTTGSFWNTTGNQEGRTLFGGTLDNQQVQFLVNNANFMRLQTGANGTIHMQGTNPGISFGPVGSFAAADYFIQRIANVNTLNVATAGLISHTIQGVSVNSMSAANGHLFNSSAGVFQMQLNASGQLLVGGNSQTASNLVAFNSTTQAIRLTNQTGVQMNAIANDAGMITYNTTAGQPYYNNGSAWLPFAGGLAAVTADNGLSTSSISNVQLGGTGSQLLGNTTITTSAFSLTIPSSNATNTLAVTNSSSGMAINASSTSGVAITGTAAALYAVGGNNTAGGYGVYGASVSGVGVRGEGPNGVFGQSQSAYGGVFESNLASTNTYSGSMILSRTTSGTSAAGIGGGIDLRTEMSNGSFQITGKLKNIVTNVTSASRTSNYVFTLLNGGGENDVFTLFGNGAAQLNDYGVGSFVGTPAYGLAVDASGNIIEYPASGGPITAITADNGLSTSSATNVQLGGSALLGNTSILTSTFSLTIPSSVTNAATTGTLIVSNSGTGQAIYASSGTGTAIKGQSSSSGIGVFGISSSSIGVQGNSTSGNGLQGFSVDGMAALLTVEPASTNTVVVGEMMVRNSTGTPADGIGVSYDFFLETTTSGDQSNRIISQWTTAANATRTSQLIITGVNSTVEADLFTLSGSGAARLNKYGVNTFAGVAAFVLGVDASGNLVEVAAAGAGMANPFTTGGQLIFSVGTTPTPLNPGTPGQLLRMNAGGTAPEWATITGTGSVTSVAQTFTGGLISVAGSPITAAGTLALTVAGTSGGIPYFSSSSTWASSGVQAANAIMVGGGAGGAPSTITTATGMVAFLGAATSASLRNTMTDETGTGALYFQGGNLGTVTGGTIGTGVTLGDVTMNVAGTDATGDIYIRNVSGVLTRVAIGTAGQVLVVNPTATGLQYSTLASGGSVTAFSFTNANGFIGSVSNPTTTPTLTIGTNLIGSLVGNGTAMTAVTSSTVGQSLLVTGANAFTFGPVDFANANATTGTLGATRGGHGFAGGFTAGQIIWASSATTLTRGFLNGTANQINVASSAGGITISHAFNPNWQTLTSGAVITWNVLNGGNAVLTLTNTGATLAAPSNVTPGYTYSLRIIQGSGGGRTINTWTNVRWSDGNLPDLSNSAGQEDFVSLICVNATSFIGFYYPNVQ